MKISRLTVWLSGFVLIFALIAASGCTEKKEEKTAAFSGTAAEQPGGMRQSESVGSAREAAEPEKPAETTEAEIVTGPAPRITVFNLRPLIPVVGNTLKPEVKVSAKEGDEITLHYRWSKNDEVLPNTEDSLELSPDDFERGDRISLRVMPEAGKRKGTPLTMNVTIANAPPVITSSPSSYRFDGRVFTDQVRATDPDGDELTYVLKSAPPGVSINQNGYIRWEVPAVFTGTATMTVGVKDSQGSEATQIINFEVYQRRPAKQ